MGGTLAIHSLIVVVLAKALSVSEVIQQFFVALYLQNQRNNSEYRQDKDVSTLTHVLGDLLLDGELVIQVESLQDVHEKHHCCCLDAGFVVEVDSCAFAFMRPECQQSRDIRNQNW